MKVVFSVGAKTNSILKAISKSADNVEFFTYENIDSMIKESGLRQLEFDRLVFSEKLFTNTEEDLVKLRDYLNGKSTTVVYICSDESPDSAKRFKEILDSNKYVAPVTSKVTTNILLEFVKSDIDEIYDKYCDKDKGIETIRGTRAEAKSETSKPEPKKKKGLFGGLFGGKKNSGEKSENKNIEQEIVETAKEVAQTAMNNSAGMGVGMTVGAGSMASGIGESAVSGLANNGNIGNSEGWVKGDIGNKFNNDDFEGFSEDDFLGLGDMGEEHADTGFLDELEEDELEKALMGESSNTGEVEVDKEDHPEVEVEETVDDDLDNTPYEEPLSVWSGKGVNVESEYHTGREDSSDVIWGREEEPEVHEDESVVKIISTSQLDDSILTFNNKVKIVITDRSVNGAKLVVEASDKLSDSGNKVLLVDFDYTLNQMLSYIGVSDFYKGGHDFATMNKIPMRCGKYDFLSNGYSRGIEYYSELRDSGLFDNYDCVLCYCPLDCIDSLVGDDIYSLVDVDKLGYTDGSKESLITMLATITGLNSDAEDSLYKNFTFVGGRDHVSELRDLCIFSRYDWLENIG